MDLDAWLAETIVDAPCGPDLEYDPEFLSFEQATRGKAEQQFGDTVIAAEGPDWRAVERRGASLFMRTKDLRVSAQIVRAWVHIHGIRGLADGLAFTRALLDRQWDFVHPRLEIDGEYDALPRANALAVLGDFEGLVSDLRQANLLQITGYTVSVHDAESILTCLQGAATDPQGLGREQLVNILGKEFAAGNSVLCALQDARADLEVIRSLCLERMGPEFAPDLAALSGLLDLLARPLGGASTEEVDEGTDDPHFGAEVSPMALGGRPGSEVHSREDALRALDLVRSYLERSEPTNPAVLFIRRAEKMMTMGFMDIIRELAPDSVGQLEMITGAKRED